MKTTKTAAALTVSLLLATVLMAGCTQPSNTVAANTVANTSSGMSSQGAANTDNMSALPSSIDVESASANELLPYVGDGAYRGGANGYNDYLTVRVVVKDHAITEIECVDNEETASYYKMASKTLDDIISANSTAVDTVSGATGTSDALKAAVDDAMRGAVS